MKLKPKHASLACYGVAGGLLALSLTHLSTGIHTATGNGESEWLAWCTAAGIDAGLISMELSILASHQLVAFQRVKSLCRAGIVGTLILSAGLNVMGFWQGAETTQGQFIAVILGCFVPGMVYALIQVANAQQTSTRVPARVKTKKRTKSNIRRLEVAR